MTSFAADDPVFRRIGERVPERNAISSPNLSIVLPWFGQT
jgi:hypothetical protein